MLEPELHGGVAEDHVYDEHLAEVWDLIYCEGRGKGYREEALAVEKIVRAEVGQASSLIDVSCGTGEHLRTWEQSFGRVVGSDLSAAMVERAGHKLPGVPLHVVDMCELDLAETFDAVVTLYSALGYLPDLTAVHAAIAACARHLTPDGILVAEPWWFTDRFLAGHIGAEVVRGEGRTVTRTSHTVRGDDGRAHMDIHYVVGEGSGLRHFTEQHSFGLWTHEQYEAAFLAAGLTVEYRADEAECGLYIARRG